MFRPRILPISSRFSRQIVRHSRIVLQARRLQSTAELPKTPITSTPPPPTPPPRKNGGWRRLFRYTYRLVYISALGGIVFFAYSTPNFLFACVDWADAYLSRHPPSNQLQPDEKKKTLVVLGSGWGSTSLLKGLNTEDYHVIVVSSRNYFLFTRIPQ